MLVFTDLVAIVLRSLEQLDWVVGTSGPSCGDHVQRGNPSSDERSVGGEGGKAAPDRSG